MDDTHQPNPSHYEFPPCDFQRCEESMALFHEALGSAASSFRKAAESSMPGQRNAEPTEVRQQARLEVCTVLSRGCSATTNDGEIVVLHPKARCRTGVLCKRLVSSGLTLASA